MALLDGGSGLRAWWALRADLQAAHDRMEVLRQEIAATRAEADALREDDFAIEAAIREDLGLARPGETIVRTAPSKNPSLRNP